MLQNIVNLNITPLQNRGLCFLEVNPSGEERNGSLVPSGDDWLRNVLFFPLNFSIYAFFQ